jgi:hypothetical protein
MGRRILQTMNVTHTSSLKILNTRRGNIKERLQLCELRGSGGPIL